MASKKISPGKWLVFVEPEEVVFSDAADMKQTFTVYNPYDCPIHYKVLCSALPGKYQVNDSKGTVKPGHYTEILVELLNVSSLKIPSIDKLRIDIHRNSKLVGQKFLKSRVGLPTEIQLKEPALPGNRGGDAMTTLPLSAGSPRSIGSRLPSTGQSDHGYSATPSTANAAINTTSIDAPQGNNNCLSITIGLLCLAILALPLEGQQPTADSWPSWLHTTFTMKLFASFILGLVAMTILRS